MERCSFIKKMNFNEIDDIILSEYGTTVVGLEMLRSVNEESAEEIRKEQIVQSAISTLSFSELEAIIIFLMNWKEQKEFLWRARSQTELGLRDLLS